MSVSTPARFPARLYGWLLAVILFFTLAPVLSVIASIAIAEANNCTLNEATTHICMVLGMDLGGLLAFMFIMGWFALATLPLGGGALIVWLVILIIHRIAWARMQKAATS
ncbi:hypothetical protein [Devosia sp. CAU 1758]